MMLSFRVSGRALWLLLASVATLWVAACSLNGQPTPPVDFENTDEGTGGKDASSSDSSKTQQDGGTFFSDAAQAPSDAPADPLDSSADGGLDASVDGG